MSISSFRSLLSARTLAKVLLQHWGTLMLVAVTVALAGFLTTKVIRPGYLDPSSRIYTSRLGYASVLRSQGQPFPVTTATVVRRDVANVFLGEGLVQSDPIQAPVIPMSHIAGVYVQEGDRVAKGQLLAELDDTRARIKIQAAEAAIQTAVAEYERTRIGSAYVLDQERPERDAIRLQQFEAEAAIKSERLQMTETLLKKNAARRSDLLAQKLDVVEAESRLEQIRWALKVAEEGRVHSLAIAKSAIAEARLALAHRQHEIKDYQVFAPADGIIERCLIHEGEYNQDPGKPAFLIASGVWFQAHLDQTAVEHVQVGDAAEVYLEAFPSRTFSGHIARIHPVVSYNLGGPETNRPIRPLGTGAPEWPATFSVQIKLSAGEDSLVPGLTGFARIRAVRHGLAVPRAAVHAISGQRAIVFVTQGASYEPRDVTLGFSADGWTEIRRGLSEGDVVIMEGHQVLEPGDPIEPTAHIMGTNVDINGSKANRP